MKKMPKKPFYTNKNHEKCNFSTKKDQIFGLKLCTLFFICSRSQCLGLCWSTTESACSNLNRCHSKRVKKCGAGRSQKWRPSTTLMISSDFHFWVWFHPIFFFHPLEKKQSRVCSNDFTFLLRDKKKQYCAFFYVGLIQVQQIGSDKRNKRLHSLRETIGCFKKYLYTCFVVHMVYQNP